VELEYTTPEGYYDEPFIFVYDASSLLNGMTAMNQSVPMDPAVGTFILRRVVGIRSVVNPVRGQIQIQDALLRYFQSFPVYASGTDELAVIPEQKYEPTGAIRFDLYDVLIAT
jgi:hypothetical protein